MVIGLAARSEEGVLELEVMVAPPYETTELYTLNGYNSESDVM